MRILFCNYEYPPLGGGGGVVTAWLAEELARRHNVTVLTSRALGLPSEEMTRNVRILRVPVLFRRHRAAASLTSLVTFVPSGISTARRLGRLGPFDIVNTHFVLPSGPVGSFISRHYEIPNVLTVHGGDLYDPSKWTSPHRHFILRALVRRHLRRADAVIGQSMDTIENIERFYTKDVAAVRIPLGIPRPLPPAGNRRDHGFAHDDVLLVSVGRLVPRKANPQLVDMICRLSQPNVKLVFLGDGPEAPDLVNLIAARGLSQSVVLKGHVTEQEKADILSFSDIFVSTSQHEGFGIVFLEAMAAGLPIVCYDRGGQTDFLKTGKTGHVVPLNDVQGFVNAVESLVRDADLRRKMGQENSLLAKEFFIENCAERYERIFENVLAARPRHDRS